MEAGQARHAISLDVQSQTEDSEEIRSKRLGRSDPGFDTVEYGAAIEEVLDSLLRRDRVVLHLRFVEDMTQTEIAQRVGISQMHVSRVLARPCGGFASKYPPPGNLGRHRSVRSPPAPEASSSPPRIASRPGGRRRGPSTQFEIAGRDGARRSDHRRARPRHKRPGSRSITPRFRSEPKCEPDDRRRA